MRYFTNKLFRGLRIPSSYLPTGPDDSQQSYNDGRVGTAFIQELRFNKYCQRLQSMVAPVFDEEFKLWIRNKGYNVDNSLFEIKLNPPQNFAQYRQTEMDQSRVGTYVQVAELPYMSKRFALKRFLGLTEEEMARNSELWAEENNVAQKKQTKSTQMRTAGISQAGIQDDLDQFAEPEGETGAPEPGAPGATPGATTGTGNTGTPGTTPGGGGTL